MQTLRVVPAERCLLVGVYCAMRRATEIRHLRIASSAQIPTISLIVLAIVPSFFLVLL